MKNNYTLIIISTFLALFAILFFLIKGNEEPMVEVATSAGNASSSQPSDRLASTFSDADLSQSLVEFDKILWGGVVKDGIPALTDPSFDPLSASQAPGDTLGVFLELNGVKRFYPYNILVAHEVVNDSIGSDSFAVTFCPLCGSAIVFNRTVAGEVKEFGVSGFLFESNLIMYDRTDTPSLWSQARTEAIVGDQAGTKLDLIDFQLLTQDDVAKLHPDAQILSANTGTGRQYNYDPYSGYGDTESTIFPISVNDDRFPAKEVFFILPRDDDSSVAIQVANLDRGETLENNELELTISKSVDGELEITDNGTVVNGYYEMWFSWAQHHQDNGQVWDI